MLDILVYTDFPIYKIKSEVELAPVLYLFYFTRNDTLNEDTFVTNW
jgi:hypothetical protein